MGLVTLFTDVTIYAFVLMPNHIHIILSGTGPQCLKVFSYLKRKISSRLKSDGYPPLPKDYGFKLIPIESMEQMRNNIIYVIRNPYEKLWSVPGGYPWGTGMYYFSLAGQLLKGRPVEEMSERELFQLAGTRKKLPPHWQIHPVFGLLPAGFINMKLINKLFPSPKDYETHLIKDYESYVTVADEIGETPDYSLQEGWNIVNQLLDGKPLSQLNADEKGQLAVRLNQFKMTPILISQLLGMPEYLVKQFINSRDYGRQPQTRR